MASIIPTGFSLQSIKNSSVVDKTVSTLKETFKKFSDGLSAHQAKGESSLSDDSSSLLLDLADRFIAHVQGVNRATMSANDGIAMIQVVDSGLSEIQAGFESLQAHAARSVSGALNDVDRQTLQAQVQQIQAQRDHIVKNTHYDAIPVLATSKNILLQTDVNADTQMTISLKDFSKAFTPIDISNRAGAEAGLSFLKEDIEMVSNARTRLVAQESKLIKAAHTLETMSPYLTGTGERIQSVDLAQRLSDAAVATIRAYPSMAIQTQANQSAAKVQTLL